jgi:putative membrane protein insertion efficiency factor
MINIQKIVNFPIILIVKIYQFVLSPLSPASCRYNPTCSNYMIEAIKIWGPIKGVFLGLKRISRCHPWSSLGDDPVPNKQNKK